MFASQWWTVAVPRALLTDRNLAPGARLTYMALRSHSRGGNPVHIAVKNLLPQSRLAGREAIGRYIKALQQNGWVETAQAKGRQPTGYRFTTPLTKDQTTVRVPIGLIRHPDLTVAAKCLYALLLALGDSESATLGRLQLIEQAGIGHDNAVRAALRQLQTTGWLRSRRNASHQTYTHELLDPHLHARHTLQRRAAARLAEAEFYGEKLMHLMLRTLVDNPGYVENVRLEKITNPTTGDQLEFDGWFPTANVAFEFNGPQHDGPTAVFPDAEAAKLQMMRDAFKEALAIRNKIVLIVVPPQELTFAQLRQKIGDLLPMHELHLADPLVAFLTKASRRYAYNARAGRV